MSNPLFLPVAALPPFAGTFHELGLRQIDFSLDKLPPFTLVLPLPDVDPEEIHLARVQTLLTLRYRDETRYIIWSSITDDNDDREKILNNLDTLKLKCEYLAQWQPGPMRVGYPKVMPGGSNPCLALDDFCYPLFYIRPSEQRSDPVDVKVIYYDWEALPSYAMLNYPPKWLKDPGNDQDLFIDGLPNGIRSLVDFAFRSLRQRKITHAFCGLIAEYVNEPRFVQSWSSPRTVNSQGVLLVDWWDPEEQIDVMFHKQPQDMLHMSPVDPERMLHFKSTNTPFIHHQPLNLSLNASSFRMLETDITSDASTLPARWRMTNWALDDVDLPPYVHLQVFGAVSNQTMNQWDVIRVNGKDVCISPTVTGAIKLVIANAKVGIKNDKTSIIYIFLPELCMNTCDASELLHYECLWDRIVEGASSMLQTQDISNDTSLASLNSQSGRIYESLDQNPRAIRLLHLQDPDTPLDSPLTAHMLTTSLEDAPDFVALSYCWGVPKGTGTIAIDDKPFRITENLQVALKYLRKFAGNKHVFVDFLCINQNDLEERAKQLGLLTDIYSSAVQTFAWLGETETEFGFTVELLRDLYNNVEHTEEGTNPWGPIDMDSELFETIRNLLESDVQVENLKLLYQSTWWERLWILQEAAMTQSLFLAAGTTSISWHDFRKAHRILFMFLHSKDDQYEIADTYAAKSLEKFLPFASEIESEREAQESARRDEIDDSFLWSIKLLSARKFSEPRDVVYAAGMLTKNPPKIIPNYKHPIRKVYQDAARAIIESQNDLKLLSFGLFSRRRYESPQAGEDVPIEIKSYWPSWVPDWRLRSWGLGSLFFMLQSRGTLVGPHLFFDACASLPAKIKFSEDGKVLHASGVKVGTVQQVVRASEDNEAKEFAEMMRAELGTQWEMLELTPPNGSYRYIAGGSWHQAWQETCKVMDREFLPLEDKQANRKLHHAKVEDLSSILSNENVASHNKETAAASTREGSPSDQVDRILRPQEIQFRDGRTVGVRRFLLIALDTGHVGFGGHAVQEGDIVTILKGCRYPVLLRPRKDGLFHKVSDSYIHGIMYGEFLRKHENNTTSDIQWVEFGIV